MLWPVPVKQTEASLTVYAYDGEVVLLVPLTVSKEMKPGSYPIAGDVDWLECEKVCVVRRARVEARLVVGEQSALSGQAALIEQWRQRLPKRDAPSPVTAGWAGPGTNDERVVRFEWKENGAPPHSFDFYAYGGEGFEVETTTTRLPGQPVWTKVVRRTGDAWPKELAGLVILERQAGAPRQASEVKMSLAGSERTATDAPVRAMGTLGNGLAAPQPPLWRMLIYAFVGGLILNLMPCVLPVIALKVAGFVAQSGESIAQRRVLGLTYGAGVLTSFLLLAGVVLGLKTAGRTVGWGMQFGSGVVLVCLTVLMALVALNLFGVFEVNLGGRAMGAAAEAAGREGMAGAFFHGVLATVLATPCTAPMLGAALGFAFAPAQRAATVVLVFATIAMGLAAPYVLLSWQPGLVRWLPKPGPWMSKLKVAMGFPMLAATIWLFMLAEVHYGKRLLALGLFLAVLAFAAWVYGEFAQRSQARRGIASVCSLALVVGGYLVLLEGQLDWRDPRPSQVARGAVPGGIDWQPWSPQAVQEARTAGRPVFVDFTADWCLTCQANKKTSIEVASVRQKLREIDAVALLADYTLLPQQMTEELNRHGRAGVPLVLVYPQDPEENPQVLPELLTPRIVLDALEWAGGQQM